MELGPFHGLWSSVVPPFFLAAHGFVLPGA